HRNLAGYAAAVSGIDRMLSRVLAEMEAQGLLENTIVLFTSDNGFSCGHHGIWGKGNGTFPLNFWENSIRVPFIAWGPGRIAGGRVSDQLLSATSVFATVLELAGVSAPPDPLRTGRSFAGLLTEGGDADAPGASEVLVLDEYGDNRMIRTRRWKYVSRRRGPDELYDLDTDPRRRSTSPLIPASLPCGQISPRDCRRASSSAASPSWTDGSCRSPVTDSVGRWATLIDRARSSSRAIEARWDRAPPPSARTMSVMSTPAPDAPPARPAPSRPAARAPGGSGHPGGAHRGLRGPADDERARRAGVRTGPGR